MLLDGVETTHRGGPSPCPITLWFFGVSIGFHVALPIFVLKYKEKTLRKFIIISSSTPTFSCHSSWKISLKPTPDLPLCDVSVEGPPGFFFSGGIRLTKLILLFSNKHMDFLWLNRSEFSCDFKETRYIWQARKYSSKWRSEVYYSLEKNLRKKGLSLVIALHHGYTLWPYDLTWTHAWSEQMPSLTQILEPFMVRSQSIKGMPKFTTTGTHTTTKLIIGWRHLCKFMQVVYLYNTSIKNI